MSVTKPNRNCLISVYSKNKRIVSVVKQLVRLGFNIYSSEGTDKYLKQNKIETINIQRLTGFPPILDHRVVTLHPKIHAGILAKSTRGHEKELRRLKIPKFNLIIVDVYPVWDVIKSGNLEKVLDLIDIGGPTMLRAAAKNFNNGSTVVCDMSDLSWVVDQIKINGEVDLGERKKLAARVFSLMERYDGAVSRFLARTQAHGPTSVPKFLGIKKLRYGENPHQKGWYEPDSTTDSLAIQNFKQIQGKELSFNNYLDVDAAVFALSQVGGKKPACVIIKHTNPVGFSIKELIEMVYEAAWYEGDPLAAFGSVIGVNRSIDEKLVGQMLVGKSRERKFFEVLLAPSIDKDALKLLSTRKYLRVLINPALKNPKPSIDRDFKKIRGGILHQDSDVNEIREKNLKIVTKKKPTSKQIKDLLFAWKAVRVCKSNAVCLVKNQTLIASGVGQQDRKESCKIAVMKARDSSRGKSKSTPLNSVAASDAFFPFPDGPKILINAGITAIIQPGGSIRDQEAIDLCNKKGIVMVFTATRSFLH